MARIVCPACAAVYQLSEDFMGKKLVCHQCQSRLLWTATGVTVIEQAVEAFNPSAGGGRELVAEVQFEESPAEVRGAEAPPAADEAGGQDSEEVASRRQHAHYARHPRRKRSLAVPIAIFTITALVCLGVVAFAVVLLVMGLSKSDKQSTEPIVFTGTVPRHLPEEMGWMEGMPPGMPAPNSGEKADFYLASLEKLGMVSFQPAGPIQSVSTDLMPQTASQPTPEFIRRLKQASVFIRVNRREGTGTGSGFFCLEPGLVVTNAHVVGMVRPSDPPPSKVEVTLNSGEANAVELPARVLGVDRVNDLAVLRVESRAGGGQLPSPFHLFPSSQLLETQQVFVAGFPRASELGTSLSVSTASVAALRKDAGRMRRVQVNGNMQPGNSGGPVFDTQGRVVGVSAAILGQTGINFAVPTEFIHDLVYGGVERLVVFPAVNTDGGLRIPVLVRLTDALSRISQVEVESWVAQAGNEYPPALEKPEPKEGDSPVTRNKLTLTRSRGQISARGYIPVPAVGQGQSLFLRVVLPSATGKTRWYAAVPYQPAAASHQSAVPLPTDEEPEAVTVACRSQFRIHIPGGELSLSPLGLFHEHRFVRQPGAEKDPSKVKYEHFQIGARANDVPLPLFQMHQVLMASAGYGAVLQQKMDLSELQAGDRYRLGSVADIAQALANLRTLNLPAEGTTFGTQWNLRWPLPFSALIGRVELRDVVISCTSLGTDPAGSGDVLVELSSEIKVQHDLPAVGWLRGLARVVPPSGRIRALQLAADVEVENFVSQGVPITINERPVMGVTLFLNGRVEYLVEHSSAASTEVPSGNSSDQSDNKPPSPPGGDAANEPQGKPPSRR
jgi:S1-C subfamily serine protease